MRASLTDRRIILALVGALFFEITLLLWHMGVISFGVHSSMNGEKPAGVVSKTSNDLRRRSLNSLVWEKSTENESVFYFDSVLTLAQSTAQLKLNGGIDVDLSENTLVTIEPRERNSTAEIRLKFERGNLAARNPYNTAKIEGQGFSVDLAKGSELQLRQTSEQEFEVQVKKGEVQVASGDGVKALGEDGLLRIAGGKTSELKLDRDLKWKNAPSRRIYTHGDDAPIELAWDGPAAELRLQELGQPEKVIPLEREVSKMELRLPAGHHLAYLRSEGKTSEPVEVEVWRAPNLHLIMPLPRNRLRTGEMNTFLWTRMPEAVSYELRIDGLPASVAERLDTNSVSLKFSDEADAEWGVWARDKQGFLIPPLYKYPVYMRHEPFAAPKLFSPKLRTPASKKRDGAFLWKWMIETVMPSAYADDKWEAVFAWEKVPGADRYLIEISETADFRKPVLSRETSNPEFIWSEYRKRIYYWRVAAGSSSGRMGVFSEPALVEETVEIRRVDPVAAKTVEEPPPLPEQKNSEYEANGSSPEKQIAADPIVPVVRLHEPHGSRFFWQPGYVSWDARAKQTVHAGLSGMRYMSFAFERDFAAGESKWWSLDVFYSQVLFKPYPAAEYPYQKNVIVQTGALAFSRMKAESNLGYGFSLRVVPKISRAGYEEIKNEKQAVAGAHIRGLWNFGALEYRLSLGGLVGSGVYGIATDHRLLYPFMRRHGFIGVTGSADYLLRGSYKTLGGEGSAILGFGF